MHNNLQQRRVVERGMDLELTWRGTVVLRYRSTVPYSTQNLHPAVNLLSGAESVTSISFGLPWTTVTYRMATVLT